MYEFLSYRVSDVMVAEVVTVTVSTTLAEAAALFEGHDFNGLPVLDRDGRLAGFLTKLDVLKAFAFTPQSVVPHYDDIVREPVERFMSGALLTAEPDTPLTRVLQTMIEHRCKSLPVTANGRLVGVVAREDILRGLRRAVAGEPPRR